MEAQVVMVVLACILSFTACKKKVADLAQGTTFL